MFHVECESHLSGLKNEQICYCSYDLCNELSSGAGGGDPRQLINKVLASIVVMYFVVL